MLKGDDFVTFAFGDTFYGVDAVVNICQLLPRNYIDFKVECKPNKIYVTVGKEDYEKKIKEQFGEKEIDFHRYKT